MELYLTLAIPVILATAWLYTAQVTRTSLPSLHNKRICLLIAHPDDEAMFFSPTLLALTAPEMGNHVKILCLSSGSFMHMITLPVQTIITLIGSVHRECRWPWGDSQARTRGLKYNTRSPLSI